MYAADTETREEKMKFCKKHPQPDLLGLTWVDLLGGNKNWSKGSHEFFMTATSWEWARFMGKKREFNHHFSWDFMAEWHLQ
jgi:hypothetical protein